MHDDLDSGPDGDCVQAADGRMCTKVHLRLLIREQERRCPADARGAAMADWAWSASWGNEGVADYVPRLCLNNKKELNTLKQFWALVRH